MQNRFTSQEIQLTKRAPQFTGHCKYLTAGSFNLKKTFTRFCKGALNLSSLLNSREPQYPRQRNISLIEHVAFALNRTLFSSAAAVLSRTLKLPRQKNHSEHPFYRTTSDCFRYYTKKEGNILLGKYSIQITVKWLFTREIIIEISRRSGVWPSKRESPAKIKKLRI